MWKNKHVVIALLVAPILALTAYVATDRVVSERPHAARADVDYPLQVKSNCRYHSGLCQLENGDVKLTLRVEISPPGPATLRLLSVLPLRGAWVALAPTQAPHAGPQGMVADDDSAQSWSAALPATMATEATEAVLRLVVLVGDSRYFAEVPTVFFARLQPRQTPDARR